MSDYRDDIEKYCKGELSPSEMHALEKRALTDPFLADALEGAQSIHSEELSSDLAHLRRQLLRPERPSVSLWTWAGRIAAGIAVLAAATFLIVNISNKKDDKPKIAYTQKPAQKDSAVTALPETKQDQAPVQNEIKPESEEGAVASRSAAKKPAEETQPSRVSPQAGDVVEESVEEEVLVPESVPSPSAAHAPAAAGADDESDKKSKQIQSPKNVVRGYVVDSEDGKGLPGVNVTIKGTNFGTITDAEGNYEIPMDSLTAGLQFSYIGFENVEVVPGSVNDAVNVAMKPDISQLSEVVVVGHLPSYDYITVDPPTIELASPVGGRRAYKQYLEQNLRYPDQAINHKVEGKVTVQFTIEPTGKLADFQVLKGLGYGCDEEVIRLIKQGPKWNPTRKNKETVRDKIKVRMRFSLPKK